MITEDQLNAAAARTRTSMEQMLGAFDVVEAYQVGMEVYGTPRPLCLNSGLEFISNPATGFSIGPKTGPKKYRRQLALCESCQLTAECLRVALREGRKEGIWGGTMPRDRTGQYA